jgi:hypothetical protein
MVDGYAPVEPMDIRTWPLWNALRPHAAEVIGHGDRAGVGEPTWRLANDLGVLLYAKGLHRDAEPLLRKVLALVEGLHGAVHRSVPKGTQQPGVAAQGHEPWLLKDTNRLAEAEPLMHRALAIDEAAYGPDDPEVATDLDRLTVLLYKMRGQAEAEPLIRRSLAVREAASGPKHPDVATSLSYLAEILESTNRLAEAEPLIAIVDAAYGPVHPSGPRDS